MSCDTQTIKVNSKTNTIDAVSAIYSNGVNSSEFDDTGDRVIYPASLDAVVFIDEALSHNNIVLFIRDADGFVDMDNYNAGKLIRFIWRIDFPYAIWEIDTESNHAEWLDKINKAMQAQEYLALADLFG